MNKIIAMLFTLLAVVVIADSKAISPEIPPCVNCLPDSEEYHRFKRDLQTLVDSISNSALALSKSTFNFIDDLFHPKTVVVHGGTNDQVINNSLNKSTFTFLDDLIHPKRVVVHNGTNRQNIDNSVNVDNGK